MTDEYTRKHGPGSPLDIMDIMKTTTQELERESEGLQTITMSRDILRFNGEGRIEHDTHWYLHFDISIVSGTDRY